MTELGLETVAPVIVKGIDDRLSRLVVRAANERQDVDVVEWDIAGTQQDIDAHTQLLRSDSVYGRLPVHPLDTSVIVRSNHLSSYSPLAVPIIATEGITPTMSQRFLFVPPGIKTHDHHDLGMVVSAQPKIEMGSPQSELDFTRWFPVVPRAVDATRYGVDNGLNPMLVVDPLYLATIPVLEVLGEVLGIGGGSITEIRNYDPEQAATDQANSTRTIEESRAATQSTVPRSVRRDIKMTGRQRNDGAGYHPDTNGLIHFLAGNRITSYSVNQPVGAVALLDVEIRTRANLDDIRNVIGQDPRVNFDDVRTSIDAKQDPRSGIINPDQIVLEYGHLRIPVFYDREWMRAHRLLDVARDAYHNRQQQVAS